MRPSNSSMCSASMEAARRRCRSDRRESHPACGSGGGARRSLRRRQVDAPAFAGLLERPNGGDVLVAGRRQPGWTMPRARRSAGPRSASSTSSTILLPEFSALENVMMPQLIAGQTRPVAQSRASELLAFLGLGARLSHRPAELSGGEQQRVAIARAVANAPRLLMATSRPATSIRRRRSMSSRRCSPSCAPPASRPSSPRTTSIFARRMDRRVTLQGGQIVELA